jgi:hypothetical protein
MSSLNKMSIVTGVAALLFAACATLGTLETYHADLSACVTNAKTRAQADACRAAVDARYCAPDGAFADAGVCPSAPVVDAGPAPVTDGAKE